MAEVLFGMAQKHAASILPFFSVMEADGVRDSSFWARDPQRCLAGLTLTFGSRQTSRVPQVNSSSVGSNLQGRFPFVSLLFY